MSRLIRLALICFITAGSASLMTTGCAGPTDVILGTEGDAPGTPPDSTRGNGYDNNN